jgi:hypothetical protein
MKKIVCVTKTYNNTTYEGGIIIGQIYDVVDYLPTVAPNGRFRIKGKFEQLRIMTDIYPKELFITLEQWRDNQLNLIGI